MSMLMLLMLAGQFPSMPSSARSVVRAAPVVVSAAQKARREKLLSEGKVLLETANQRKATLASSPVAVPNSTVTSATANAAELEKAIDEAKSAQDSLSSMSESDQLRLQTAMDRLAKAQQTLSNILKTFSDTQAAIVSNVK